LIESFITKDDYEIFDLVDELENAEGDGANFYSFLEIESTATEKDINRAYRKKSLLLQCVFAFYSLSTRNRR
jgi:hypothetical protein